MQLAAIVGYISVILSAITPESHEFTFATMAAPGRALVPFPQHVHWDELIYQLNSREFEIRLGSDSPADCDILEQAIERYWRIIFPSSSVQRRRSNRRGNRNSGTLFKQPQLHSRRKRESCKRRSVRDSDEALTGTSGCLNALVLNVVSGLCENQPSLQMDESYDISFADGGASISSPAVWGALRGLETFSQLVDGSGSELFVQSAQIRDWPRFKFRGIMLDTSRHFLSKNNILQHLDLAAQNKLNVFHWHVTDDASFPYQSEAFPALSAKGAYTENHVYTQADIAEIVEYARLRGIRVIPEFDTPGHTRSWEWGLPGLLTKCAPGRGEHEYGPINPANASNFDVLSALFREIMAVFPDASVHLGGDEVADACWLGNSDVRNWMTVQGISSGEEVQRSYNTMLMNRLMQIRPERDYLFWQEVFDYNALSSTKNTIVQVWKEGSFADTLAKVTRAGYRAVLSSCWYLNYIHYDPDWEQFYRCDPQNFDGSAEQKALVLGGTACLWGEYLDGTNGIPTLWPRASVVAERLWSAAGLTSASEFAGRYDRHRCRLVKRGYPASPTGVRLASFERGYCEEEWEASE